MISKILSNKIVKKTIEIVCIVGLSTIINTSLQENKKQNNIVSAQVIEAQAISNKSLVQDDKDFKNIIEKCLIDSSLKISEVGKTPSGNSFIDLNNGSWIVYDLKNNEIIFQPIELGDWDYSFNNIDDAKACITTYANNSYSKMNNQVNNVIENNSSDFNITDDIENNKQGITINNQDWTSNNNKNSDLTKDVVIETKDNIITIDKDTCNTIEYGENSDLKGDIYIEADDIKNIINKDINNKEYTEEDYNNYLEYKNNLIEEYGEEIYNLMNQEAGISSEEESFIHYMEYGI